MMLALGMFVFMLQTLPYQNLQRQTDYRWPTNDRVCLRAIPQFLGPGAEKITLSGELLPEITGGKLSLMGLHLMADQGMAWSLIGGDGTIYGMFVVESLSETYSELFADGSARRIEFTVNLLRVDESLAAMFGDLKEQANGLMDGAEGAAERAKTFVGGYLS
ncbi:phage tail protein [Ewingella americana]|uniref:phage tail protein n=1 Tax=Ewingella americana TaxID=41202 RepID=UPI0012AE4073|nr:phage tail protein [Ewingella americana]MRT03166.1 phage tail protein [Ewingella americana]